MSEEIKTEPVEDEENLKTTPVRASSLRDCERHSDDEIQPQSTQTQNQTNDKDDVTDKASDAVDDIEVKTDPDDDDDLGDKNEAAQGKEKEHVIETLVAGTNNGQEEPKTPEKSGKRTPQKSTREEDGVTVVVNGVNEPIGRKQLFADNSKEINVTIGTFRAQVEPPINNEIVKEIEQIAGNVTQEEPVPMETGGSTNIETQNLPIFDNLEAELQAMTGENINEAEFPAITREISSETELQALTGENSNEAVLQAMTGKNSNEAEPEAMMAKNSKVSSTDPENPPEPVEAQNEIPTEIPEVKIEPTLDNQESMDLDTTITRPISEITNTGQEIITEETEKENSLQAPEIPVKTEPTVEDFNEPMDFDETFTRPTTSARQTEPQPAPLKSSTHVRDSLDGTATPRIRDTIDGTATPIIRYAMDGAATPRRDAIDGTATPRISVTPMSRLRVKTEFTLNQATPNDQEESSLPHDFFEDLLNVEKRSESGELSPTNSDARSEDEPIPENFFDDLLRDKLKERIEEAKNDELEEKYSDRLKELENLESELKRLEEKSRERKKHKKQKKSKKKSHKRSRSRSPPPPASRQRLDRVKRSPSPNHSKNKRSRMTPPPPPVLKKQLPSTSNYGNLNKVSENVPPSTLSSTKSIQVKSEFRTFDKSNEVSLSRDFDEDIEMMVHPVKVEEEPVIIFEEIEEIEEILTPKQKREKAMKRASALLTQLKDMSPADQVLSKFQFTSTVRKLPTSHSYVHQHIYENRSPLHTVNNVNYKFNSHATRFNMEEWGLATLPTHAAKIAKLVGCDALTIHNKLKTIKIPSKLQKVKNEINDQGEEVIETTSSFFCNVMTQTDEVDELTQRKTKGYEIGIQVEPIVCDIGCQTLETQSPTKNNQSDPDELPIMKIMRDLNENQLMAIHDFAELIKEPAANAMDMYSLRMRMLDIYKCSQLPSALATPQPQVINNYTTSSPRSSPQTHRRSQPIIQSVSAADGSHFSINDPRAKSAAYTSRGGGSGSSSSNYDPRYSAFTQPSSRSPSTDSRNSSNSPSPRYRPSSNQQPPTTSSSTKFYGRGGLRR